MHQLRRGDSAPRGEISATADYDPERIAAAGRARWKIENENNNTLKTKGYHLEHNFGHGKEHLSTLLAAMNILAFLYHTFLSFTDEHYRLIRAALPTRKTFFDDLRALTRYLLFANWAEPTKNGAALVSEVRIAAVDRRVTVVKLRRNLDCWRMWESSELLRNLASKLPGVTIFHSIKSLILPITGVQ